MGGRAEVTYFTCVKGDWHTVRISGLEKGFVTLEEQNQKAHRTSHGSLHCFCILKLQIESLLSDVGTVWRLENPG